MLSLGHIVGKEQLKPDSEKVTVIKQAPRPITKKHLGLVGFYRKFVPNFAYIALQLTDLTKKGSPTKIAWDQCHELAFQKLKSALTHCPIMKLPDVKDIFILD
jgi:hypothetical protein